MSEIAPNRIVIAGGTGFLGKYLRNFFTKKGFEVIVLSRHPQSQENTFGYEKTSEFIKDAKAVINLAGENLFDKRWTPELKQQIIQSRVETTRKLVQSINSASKKPEVFISASAVGFYGDRGTEILKENSISGTDFLAEVCRKWEAEAQNIKETRLVIPRIGIVLGGQGGALKRIVTPYKFFVGGSLGSGKQYFPWVHIQDVAESILFAIESESVSGAYNCTAPQSITMAQFSIVLGKVMRRPSFFKVPKFALTFVLGEASESLLSSQRAVPEQLRKWNYTFRYEDIKGALRELV